MTLSAQHWNGNEDIDEAIRYANQVLAHEDIPAELIEAAEEANTAWLDALDELEASRDGDASPRAQYAERMELEFLAALKALEMEG